MEAMKIVPAMLMVMLAGGALADTSSPAGVWKSIDDKTKKERSIIRITEVNGEFKGVVEKIFDQPGDDPAHLCKECKDERKDKPIVGMTILWGLKKDGDGWSGGEILDPKNGKIYRAKMSLSEDGKSLKVRGFIGISLIGRTQTWLREQ
ncbi:MAG: DUF2147 domain-containing protein [Pseudomonadota bacterium]